MVFRKKNRKVIVDSIFGPNGALMSETDHASLSDMMSHIAECHEDHVARYIRRLIPMLAEHMQATERQGLVIQTKLWTNNNCESINNVLKSYTSWKPLKLPELVPTLEEESMPSTERLVGLYSAWVILNCLSSSRNFSYQEMPSTARLTSRGKPT